MPRSKIREKIVVLVNRTTRVEIRDGKRVFGQRTEATDQPLEPRITELGEDGLRLETPPRTCATKHRLELKLEFANASTKIALTALGVVEEVDSSSRAADAVLLRFTQFAPKDQGKWEEVLALYSRRQTHTLRLFEKLKGD